MKKMDEMERNIQLRAKERSYHMILLALGIWTFYNCWQTLQNGASYHPLPGLLVCGGACIQGASQELMKRKMAAGEEGYREPRTLLWASVAAAAVSTVLLAVVTVHKGLRS